MYRLLITTLKTHWFYTSA